MGLRGSVIGVVRRGVGLILRGGCRAQGRVVCSRPARPRWRRRRQRGGVWGCRLDEEEEEEEEEGLEEEGGVIRCEVEEGRGEG